MSFETAFAVVGFVVVGVFAFAAMLLWEHRQAERAASRRHLNDIDEQIGRVRALRRRR